MPGFEYDTESGSPRYLLGKELIDKPNISANSPLFLQLLLKYALLLSLLILRLVLLYKLFRSPLSSLTNDLSALQKTNRSSAKSKRLICSWSLLFNGLIHPDSNANCICIEKNSITITKMNGDKGSPCRIPLLLLK